MRMKGILFVALIGVAGVVRADANWTGNAGDNSLNTSGNWDAGVPSGAQAIFRSTGLGPLTMSADLTFSRLITQGTGLIDFDLGADRTLTLSQRIHTQNSGDAIRFTSGTVAMSGERLLLGDNIGNQAIYLQGANTALRHTGTSGNTYIQIGSPGTGGTGNNLFEVSDGALLEGWVIMGRLTRAGNCAGIFGGTNTLRVTGVGSRYVSNAAGMSVGEMQGWAQFLVEKGASATIKGGLALGKYRHENDSNHSVGGENLVRVSDGSTFTVEGGNVYVGQASPSNRFEVLSGSTMTVPYGFYTSYEDKHDVAMSKLRPLENRVLVSGEGTTFYQNNEIKIGVVAGSRGDTFEVADGAYMRITNSSDAKELAVGQTLGSQGHSFVVSNATVDCSLSVNVGDEGDGNSLRILDGATFTKTGNQFLNVGLYGSSNLLEVADGSKLNVDGQVRLGWYNRTDGTKPGYNRIWVHGEGALLTTTGDFRTDRFDGQIGNEIVIEGGGQMEIKGVFQCPYTQNVGGFSSNHLIKVSGEGSRLNLTGTEFKLACNAAVATTNVDARIVVEDGGELTLGQMPVTIGNGDNDARTVCARNGLIVGPGGRFRQTLDNKSFQFRLGTSGNACDNFVRVAGTFALTNLNAEASRLVVGYNGSGNRFEVVDGGFASVHGDACTVGFNATATDCRLKVAGTDSRLILSGSETLMVGEAGANAKLEVLDGGALDACGVNRVVVGSVASAEGASLVMTNGASARMTRLVLGDKAANCSARIDDSELTLVNHDAISSGGYLDIGYTTSGANPANATLTIAGRNGRVAADANIRMRNASAKIVFVIPDGGFANVPLTANGFETVAAGASVHVSLAEGYDSTERNELIRVKSAGELAKLTFTVDPDVYVHVVGTSVYAGKCRGTVLILR